MFQEKIWTKNLQLSHAAAAETAEVNCRSMYTSDTLIQQLLSATNTYNHLCNLLSQGKMSKIHLYYAVHV